MGRRDGMAMALNPACVRVPHLSSHGATQGCSGCCAFARRLSGGYVVPMWRRSRSPSPEDEAPRALPPPMLTPLLIPALPPPMQVRIEQVLMSTPPPLVCFRLAQLLTFYGQTMDQLLGSNSQLSGAGRGGRGKRMQCCNLLVVCVTVLLWERLCLSQG
jgi:hypothetical protein